MKSDPDKLLNQLVVAALTVFMVVIMLLAALVLRQLRLQQRIADLSTEVRGAGQSRWPGRDGRRYPAGVS